MKAIILAAGVGSRLRPITNNIPKTLVKVNKKPMLQYIIESLLENNINDIIICVGYKSECVISFCSEVFPSINFTFIENNDYETTNNLFTLYMSRSYMEDDFLLMNADLVFEAKIIEKLLDAAFSAFCIDKGVYIEESMKVTTNENGIINGISKKIIESDAFGTSIDVYKFLSKDGAALKEALVKAIEVEKKYGEWSETLFDNLIKNELIEIRPVEINGLKWFEIDNFEDLAYAEALFNEGKRKVQLQ